MRGGLGRHVVARCSKRGASKRGVAALVVVGARQRGATGAVVGGVDSTRVRSNVRGVGVEGSVGVAWKRSRSAEASNARRVTEGVVGSTLGVGATNRGAGAGVVVASVRGVRSQRRANVGAGVVTAGASPR